MPDTKITALAAITTVAPANDLFAIVDVSDNSMAASGTTKNITTNQILGAGGTATLASATISGDLTARNWFVTGGTLPGVGNGNPFAYRIGGGGLGIGAATETGTTAPIVFYCGQGGVEQYRIAPLGVNTWSDGAGGTRMTLNATGLGVGVSPSSKLTIKPSASSSGILEVLTGSTNTDSLRVSGGGTVNSWLELRGYLGVKLYSDATNTVTVDSAGQVGIGVTPSYKFHSLVASGYSGAFKASTAAITGVLIGNTVADLTVGVDASGNGRITADASKYLGLGSNGLNDRVILDSSGNVGISVTPSAWASGFKVVQFGPGSAISCNTNASRCDVSANYFYDGANKFITASGYATNLTQENGNFYFYRSTATSGGAGAACTFTQAMTLDASGNLLVGTTSLAGSSSNATAVILGSARTANGSVSTTTAVASTIFSITAALRGRYEVVALIANSGSPASYTSVASVIWDGNGGRVVANNGTNLTITLSGSDVQVTQTSGSAQTVFWSFLRVALA
jgi:hypothetical protein